MNSEEVKAACAKSGGKTRDHTVELVTKRLTEQGLKWQYHARFTGKLIVPRPFIFSVNILVGKTNFRMEAVRKPHIDECFPQNGIIGSAFSGMPDPQFHIAVTTILTNRWEARDADGLLSSHIRSTHSLPGIGVMLVFENWEWASTIMNEINTKIFDDDFHRDVRALKPLYKAAAVFVGEYNMNPWIETRTKTEAAIGKATSSIVDKIHAKITSLEADAARSKESIAALKEDSRVFKTLVASALQRLDRVEDGQVTMLNNLVSTHHVTQISTQLSQAKLSLQTLRLERMTGTIADGPEYAESIAGFTQTVKELTAELVKAQDCATRRLEQSVHNTSTSFGPKSIDASLDHSLDVSSSRGELILPGNIFGTPSFSASFLASTPARPTS